MLALRLSFDQQMDDATSEGSSQTALLCRLVGAFAYHLYHIVGGNIRAHDWTCINKKCILRPIFVCTELGFSSVTFRTLAVRTHNVCIQRVNKKGRMQRFKFDVPPVFLFRQHMHAVVKVFSCLGLLVVQMCSGIKVVICGKYKNLKKITII